ncbi:TPA: hypothetical protein QDC32_006685 [Burkholderia stabilis]|nr:hypothetical protein [Burkholderia stabilis]HDR9660689.1 hypothetical protein [Burkholderia stabilis]
MTGFAKSFAHRAPGRRRMASARRCRTALTGGGSAIRDDERRAGNAAGTGMIAGLPDTCVRLPALAEAASHGSPARMRRGPTTRVRIGVR